VSEALKRIIIKIIIFIAQIIIFFILRLWIIIKIIIFWTQIIIFFIWILWVIIKIITFITQIIIFLDEYFELYIYIHTQIIIFLDEYFELYIYIHTQIIIFLRWILWIIKNNNIYNTNNYISKPKTKELWVLTKDPRDLGPDARPKRNGSWPGPWAVGPNAGHNNIGSWRKTQG
jgi:hypothetical protein